MASIPFEQFHKHSADIITAAVFGKNADGEVNNEVVFATIYFVSKVTGTLPPTRVMPIVPSKRQVQWL